MNPDRIHRILRDFPGYAFPDISDVTEVGLVEVSSDSAYCVVEVGGRQRWRVSHFSPTAGQLDWIPAGRDLQLDADASAEDSTVLGDLLADHLGTSRAEAQRRALRAALIAEGIW